MGDYIKWYERYFYRDNIFRGVVLSLTLLLIVFFSCIGLVWMIEYALSGIWSTLLLGVIASTTIANKMLYDCVKDIVTHPSHIKYLVSRDTESLSPSDINKATIETYAENLSDGVIAPLFYLAMFGLAGAFIYKAINTLDSMIGYRNSRYEKFGKFAARLDDVANLIPSRFTALLISLLMFSRKALLGCWRYGRGYDSPNAGYPIAAMALAIDVKLGGDTSYFSQIKHKPFLGDGKANIGVNDIGKALSFRFRLDMLVVLFASMYLL